MANILVSPQAPAPYVIESANSTYVVLASSQGPSGPAGPAGGGVSTQTYTVGSNSISAYTVVALSAGLAVTADSSNVSEIGNVVGVATGGALSGATVTVQFAGLLSYNGWSWVLGKPIFLGMTGLLTQTPPSSGFNQIIATTVSTTSIFINLQSPIMVS